MELKFFSAAKCNNLVPRVFSFSSMAWKERDPPVNMTAFFCCSITKDYSILTSNIGVKQWETY